MNDKRQGIVHIVGPEQALLNQEQLLFAETVTPQLTALLGP